jgi:hypothetical protein
MLVLTEAAWGNLRGFVAFAGTARARCGMLRNTVDNHKFLWRAQQASCVRRAMPV